MVEGERGSPVQMQRGAAQPSCLNAWGELSVSSQLWPDARCPFRCRTHGSESPQHTLALARFLRSFCLIGLTHRALARGAAVDEVLPPSGLVADMVVGVCLESVHYHECQHACFNQEPSSITNTALLNGKTFPPSNYSSSSFHTACLAGNVVFGAALFTDVSFWAFLWGDL